jgi:molybdate transport system ATP-binding protein
MDELPLVTFADATLLNEGRPVFPHTSWSICSGVHWAILGPNGSGKSIFAKALWDGVPVVGGRVSWPLAESVLVGATRVPGWQSDGCSPSSCVRHVSFDDQARRITRYSSYLQGRYESLEDDRAPTLVEALAAARHAATAPDGGRAAPPPLEGLLRRLGLAHAVDRPVSRLSNGELRKYLLIEALLSRPLLLVLEEPMQGLDHASRRKLARMLRAVAGLGVTLVVVTSRERDIPGMVRHVLNVGGEKVVSQGFRGRGRLHRQSHAGDLPARLLVAPPAAPERGGRRARERCGQLIVDLRDVTVRLDGTTVLDRVNWRIREGESWALTGPNGSGKTTLLSIIVGDHPQAYANDVRLFGRRRGDGQSIWEIREQVGHVSPELQALFPGNVTVEEAILSGFFDGPGAVGSGTPAQREAVRQWQTALGLAEAAQKPFASLSDGQKRLVLLARAMVKRPRLLVLDEPCQGLDEEHRALIVAAIEVMTRSRKTSLVYVTHDPRELPACIT